MKEWDRMHSSLGRDPTLKEMATKLNLSARQVKGVLDAHEASKGVGSLDTPLDEEENLFIRDIVSNKAEQGPDEMLTVLRTQDELGKALDSIGDRERKILEMRFGLNGKDRMTLEEVGKKLRLSRERVRQLEERGLLRLRRLAQRTGMV